MKAGLNIYFRRRFFHARSGLLTAIFLLGCAILGVNPASAQRPLGVDVSYYQGSEQNPPTNILWGTVKSSGISFAWTKATEGATYTDPDFTVNITKAKTAGVLIGAYHFAHPETHPGTAGADQEAAKFWSVAGPYIQGSGTYMMPMLDVESDLSTANPAYTKATLSQWVNEWCSNVVLRAASNGVVVIPIVYTYVSYSSTWLNTTVTNWPLWMAQYPSGPNPQTGAPSGISPWKSWNFWQYSSSVTVPGIKGGCDADVFNGTPAQLGAFVVGGLAAPYVTLQPLLDKAADTGGSVTFTATVGGNAPLHYQWTLNGSAVPGATNATLTITNAQTASTGNYILTATNSFGSTTSDPVSLLVYPPQATVFADNFDVNTATNWIVNRSSSDTAIAFNYDYSALGIPSAPHSTNNTTRGVQMKANLTQGVISALSISPTNQSFSGDYRLHFDAWINVNGPLPGGGASSTENLTAGLGTAGNRTEWTGSGSTADGYYFSANGDGGSVDTSTTLTDYSGYIGTTGQTVGTGIYAAGTDVSARGNGNVYYTTTFPIGQAPPTFQRSNYAQQTGSLSVGTFGFAWHDVIVSKRGSTVNWVVDGILFATISNATFTANNVFVGFWDPFASLTDNTNLNFGLVDNVRVEVPAIAPVITANPQPQVVPLGTNVTFTVTASGLPAPNYQWQFNGTNLSGATNSPLVLTNVTAANVGDYRAIATNNAGSAASAIAALQLKTPAAAQFQGIGVQPDGSVEISFSGDAVWTYTVETSTNLMTWTVLTNLTSANGVFDFTAGSTTNAPQQFYRARVGP
ncbi:MAG TPA: GH25 family lysozyme [Verrucomicrobiae bacterium]|jgi:GH25 family lysozyme M1 (1,4-beta-N-acetylmuramidase)